MNFRQLLVILWARKWMVATVFLLTSVSAVSVSQLLPKQYSATASVLIDVKSPDPLTGNYVPAVTSPTYMATQVEIIRSDRVARKVIEELKLDTSTSAQQSWLEATGGEGDIKTWLAERLIKSLDIRPARDSNLVNMTFTGEDPQFAAMIANAIAEAYVDLTVGLRVEPARQNSEWFAGQSKQLKERLEGAQAALSAYQRRSGIVATDERLDIENARLAELSSQLVALQAQSSDARSKAVQAGKATADSVPEVLQSPIVQGLKVEIARAEARLQDLSSRFGAAHPQRLSAEAELSSLRHKLETEIKRVTASLGSTVAASGQRESDIRSALEAQRAKVLALKKQRDEMTNLQRDVESAQRTMEAVSQRQTMTKMESQAAGQTNVSILSPATPPIEASFPRLKWTLALAVLVGGMLATSMALLLEMAKRRVRTAADLSAVTGTRVLAVLPAAKFSRLQTNQLKKA